MQTQTAGDICRLEFNAMKAHRHLLSAAAGPLVFYVTDRRLFPPPSRCAAGAPLGWASPLLDCIARAAEAGVDAIQLREKDLSGKALLDLAAAARSRIELGISRRGAACCAPGGAERSREEMPDSARCALLINDRLDVAIASGAAGVHLGGESVPVSAVSALRPGTASVPSLPQSFLVGCSCHSLEEALAAERDGADYVFFGPVFATPAKAQFGPPQGVSALAAVCRGVQIPVLAIGGITLENARSCIAAGAAGLAAIRLFQESSDLAAVVGALKQYG
jgi:thiamine-phosphate pyrophosphorylase